MIEKDPSNYGVLTYLWVIILSSWGGVVSFMRKQRQGKVRPFNFAELIGEIGTSAFVGMITFLLCEWSNTPSMLSAALIAISGHMGSRALFGLEQVVEHKFGIKIPDEEEIK